MALRDLVTLLLSIGASIVVGSVIMLAYEQNPIDVYTLLLRGAFGSERAFFVCLQRATPLVFTAVAFTLALRSGVFNMGIDGQLIVGAMCGTIVGVRLDMPAPVHLPMVFLAGFAGGALWAFVPAVMRQKLGISEIITTIMMNYIGSNLIAYLLMYVVRVSPMLAETDFVQQSAKLPQFQELVSGLGTGSQAHIGIIVAFAASIVVYLVLKHTTIGYEWRMAGISIPFADFVGVNVDRAAIRSFLVSGGIAGLGGIVEILGVWRRYKQGFGLGLGLKGTLAALLGGQTVVGSTIAAVFYGAMEGAGMNVEWLGTLPRQLIDILLGLVIFFAAAPGIWDVLSRIKWVAPPELVQRTSEDQQP
jgi:simple sugar transport system permease protein